MRTTTLYRVFASTFCPILLPTYAPPAAPPTVASVLVLPWPNWLPTRAPTTPPPTMPATLFLGLIWYALTDWTTPQLRQAGAACAPYEGGGAAPYPASPGPGGAAIAIADA